MKEKYGQPVIYISGVLLSALIFLLDLAIPLGAAIAVAYIAVVLLTFWSSGKRSTVVVSLACTLLIITGFFLSPPGGIQWQVFFNRFMALFAVWVTALLTVQRKIVEGERKKALEDVKILRGMLPICASCHKIRDDKGYWTQIERYIKDHSEADFTHGLCPECAEKLYPGFWKGNKVSDIEK